MVKAQVGKWYSVDHQQTRVIGECLASGAACTFRTIGGKLFYALPIDVAEEVAKPQPPAPAIHHKVGQLVRWNGQLSVVEHVCSAGKPWVSTLEGDDFTGQVLPSQIKPEAEQDHSKHGDAVVARFMARNDAVAAGAYRSAKAVDIASEASGRSPREKGTAKLAEALEEGGGQ